MWIYNFKGKNWSPSPLVPNYPLRFTRNSCLWSKYPFSLAFLSKIWLLLLTCNLKAPQIWQHNTKFKKYNSLGLLIEITLLSILTILNQIFQKKWLSKFSTRFHFSSFFPKIVTNRSSTRTWSRQKIDHFVPRTGNLANCVFGLEKTVSQCH